MSMVDPVIGPVNKHIVGAVNRPPPAPPGGPPSKPPRPGGPRGRSSKFERAIKSQGPAVWYRFRDKDFDIRIKDRSGNNEHLLKQSAAATRNAYPIRTTHPGGAEFPSVTYDNWASQGTEYKSVSGITTFNNASESTLVISCRFIKKPSAHDAKVFGVGTEDATGSNANDQVLFQHRTSDGWAASGVGRSGGLSQAETEITEEVADGVSRLFTTRHATNTILRMLTSKPGYEGLVEDNDSIPVSNIVSLSKNLILNARTNAGVGSDTTTEVIIDQIALFDSDIGATAEADLHSKWMNEVSGAGYYPSMMQFDGSTGYYSDSSYTSSGNKVTVTCRFNRDSFTGNSGEFVLAAEGPSGEDRAYITVWSSDYTTDPNYADRVLAQVTNSAGTVICLLLSATGYLDGEDHVLHFAFDGDNGAAVFRIDGVDADDAGNGSRVAPTTGTLQSGAGSDFGVGATDTGGAKFGGSIGFVGMKDAYLTNYQDFVNADDNSLPFPIDEKNWSEWDGRSAGDPGMAQFDGSTGYYRDSDYTSAGQQVTSVVRFKISSFSGGASKILTKAQAPTGVRLQLFVVSNDHAISTRRNKLMAFAQTDAGATILQLVSSSDFADGEEHTAFVAYDATAGQAIMRIDGVDEIDTGNPEHVLTTGTMDTGSSTNFNVGANGDGSLYWNGRIGFVGHTDSYLTNFSDFSTGSIPADIDEVNWTQWGSQPLFWNRTGEMSDNKGSAGNMTANGTIIPARPAFWKHTGQMDDNAGHAGDMTANGSIVMGEGGSP